MKNKYGKVAASLYPGNSVYKTALYYRHLILIMRTCAQRNWFNLPVSVLFSAFYVSNKMQQLISALWLLLSELLLSIWTLDVSIIWFSLFAFDVCILVFFQLQTFFRSGNTLTLDDRQTNYIKNYWLAVIYFCCSKCCMHSSKWHSCRFFRIVVVVVVFGMLFVAVATQASLIL